MATTIPRPAAPATPVELAAPRARSLVRPALIGLLAFTAVLYLWRLGSSGYANEYYAAAAQAGGQSWKAWFFGALDPAASITVDKPPASLWVMGLSVRIFGLSSWSLLVPQALLGVAAVGLLYATVRRSAGDWAGLAAGALLALTPVAALMFRYDQPDALLVLLLVAAAYAVTRALEQASTRWILLAGSLVGFAFLTKMLQAFLVLPAFALVYLLAANAPLRRRIWQVLAAGLALLVSAGWFVAIVELWPASSRPYIGGSTSNSLLDLVFGYNGLNRLSGGSGPGGGGGMGFSGSPSITRLFNNLMGGEISWLLPAALIALAGGLWLTVRAPRTDRVRAGLVLWGGWLLVTGAVFSFMSGIVHTYYTVALAPAVAAVVAIGGRELLLAAREPAAHLARALLAAGVAATGVWSYVLLDRTPDWHPALRFVVLGAAVVSALLLLDPRLLRRGRSWLAITGVLAALALVGGSSSYTLATASTPHTGSVPSSGPAGAARSGGPGGGGLRTNGTPPSGLPTNGTPPSGAPGFGAPPSGRGGFSPGGGGRTTTSSNSALVTLLRQDSHIHTWAAATIGANSAAPLQLASGQAVMAIGGFTGSDPSITLAQFQKLVAQGRIHWFIAGGGMGGGLGQGGTTSSISTWVAAHYTAKTVGGQTVYDLTSPKS
jgi:4-amino-4-deoxy-L-arabinose transferase-like glycosyltransferase